MNSERFEERYGNLKTHLRLHVPIWQLPLFKVTYKWGTIQAMADQGEPSILSLLFLKTRQNLWEKKEADCIVHILYWSFFENWYLLQVSGITVSILLVSIHPPLPESLISLTHLSAALGLSSLPDCPIHLSPLPSSALQFHLTFPGHLLTCFSFPGQSHATYTFTVLCQTVEVAVCLVPLFFLASVLCKSVSCESVAWMFWTLQSFCN